MVPSRGGLVSDADYIRLVRRYRPSSLVPLVSAVGATLTEPGSWLRQGTVTTVTPWALADVARVSLVSGNEFRSPATARDLDNCMRAYTAFDEPQQGQDPVMSFLFRIASEQLGFNELRYSNLLRSAALFLQTSPSKDLTILRDGWIEDLVGCSLSQYVGIGFLAHTLAVMHGGQFDEAWLSTDPSAAPITDKIPVALITDVMQRRFIGDRAFYRENRALESTPFRRYTFNPLLDRPVVVGLHEHKLVPVPALVDKKVSPLGIWYAGFERWGNMFATEVGDLFEQYVGRHLSLIPDAVVHPEIVYGSDNRRSVDWIVVMEDLVILVEVKSTRPTEPIRLGTADVWKTFSAKFSKAYEQIENTNALIEAGKVEFAAIPQGLRRCGLIVSMESFPFPNTPEVRCKMGVNSTIPTVICASSELETLVTVRGIGVDDFLLEFFNNTDRSGFDLHNELVGLGQESFCRNSVMDEAWRAYDWGLPPPSDDI